MFKVFISQPMNGKTDMQIEEDRMIATADAIMRVSNDFGIEVGKIKIMDTVLKDYTPNAHPLLYLGESIKMMAEADAVYFYIGWEKSRGCIVEHKCAEMYGKPILHW